MSTAPTHPVLHVNTEFDAILARLVGLDPLLGAEAEACEAGGPELSPRQLIEAIAVLSRADASTRHVTSGPGVRQGCGRRLAGLAPDATWVFLALVG